jgi:hypothetical protein
MNNDAEIRRTKSAAAPPGFATAFASVVLLSLTALVILCDALPAMLEPGASQFSSLYGLLFDYFWPGTITLHGGLAAIWLACGRQRFSVRLLGVLLSMNLRAVWAWWLYGVSEPDVILFGEPFIISGTPLWMLFVSMLVSLTLIRERIVQPQDATPHPRLQILDLLAWTASAAIFLALLLAFGREMTPGILADRLHYSASQMAAWGVLTFFAAWLLREWLITSRWPVRLLRLAIQASLFLVACVILIASARLIASWGPEDMAANILAYLAPSTFCWCMATGWTLRELGLRLAPRRPSQSPSANNAATP